MIERSFQPEVRRGGTWSTLFSALVLALFCGLIALMASAPPTIPGAGVPDPAQRAWLSLQAALGVASQALIAALLGASIGLLAGCWAARLRLPAAIWIVPLALPPVITAGLGAWASVGLLGLPVLGRDYGTAVMLWQNCLPIVLAMLTVAVLSAYVASRGYTAAAPPALAAEARRNGARREWIVWRHGHRGGLRLVVERFPALLLLAAGAVLVAGRMLSSRGSLAHLWFSLDTGDRLPLALLLVIIAALAWAASAVPQASPCARRVAPLRWRPGAWAGLALCALVVYLAPIDWQHSSTAAAVALLLGSLLAFTIALAGPGIGQLLAGLVYSVSCFSPFLLVLLLVGRNQENWLGLAAGLALAPVVTVYLGDELLAGWQLGFARSARALGRGSAAIVFDHFCRPRLITFGAMAAAIAARAVLLVGTASFCLPQIEGGFGDRLRRIVPGVRPETDWLVNASLWMAIVIGLFFIAHQTLRAKEVAR